MMGAHDALIPRLRWASLAASVYFAALWFMLAERHRLWGALAVFGVGGLLTLFSIHSVRLLRGAATAAPPPPPPPPPTPASPPEAMAPVLETIDAYSAKPEMPERRRARFLGALGHDLRNPLNSVTGFSDMLLGRVDGELNAEQERSVRTIRAAAERLLRLVSTVVDQARVEAGTLRLQPQWVSPSELVTEAMGFARSRAEGTSVTGGVSEGLPRVFVDRHRTVQALASLAVLVIRSSETDIAIRVAPPRRNQAGEGFVQFDLTANLKSSTADTLAIVEKLEKPLSRSDALGLEVAVAREVIETQGGRIWTEAGTAGSLRVCMTLPTSAR
jgi:signal transduction histidine kinase